MKPGDHPEFFRFPAPPGQSRESTISLDKEGKFWHDGARVDHPRLARAMHGWIARHPDDGRYILTNGYDWTYFRVDDTPFVVLSAHPRADGGIDLVLSSDDTVPLAPETLTTGDEGALYTRVTVRGAEHDARFTRFAQSQLSPVLEPSPDGAVGVRVAGTLFVPPPREPSQGG